MSHPAELPELFLDRSLGSIQVPAMLREFGLRLTTLAERYGPEHAQFVSDIDWLEEAGRRGEVVLMKDSRIYTNKLERDTVRQAQVRCFCLSKKSLTANEMGQWFLNNLPRIVAACIEPGPVMYVVYQNSIRRLEDGQ